MKARGFLVIAVTLIVACVPLNESKTPLEVELAKLQGTWQQMSGIVDGVELPNDVIQGVYITFEGNEKIVHNSESIVMRNIFIEIDPATDPKIWDEKPSKDAEFQFVSRGIYKLDGDTLTRCNAPIDGERPNEFTSRKGTGHNLQIFRRVKDDEGK